MLQKLKRADRNGFTIIEVMIVLAIAGVIMLVVFMAVPALQRSSRNTQRKNDVSSLLSAVQTAIDNNGGELPATGSPNTVQAAFGSLGLDWNPGFYNTAANVHYTNNGDTPLASDPMSTADVNSVYVETYAACPTATSIGPGTTTRSVAVEYAIEGGSGDVKQCVQM